MARLLGRVGVRLGLATTLVAVIVGVILFAQLASKPNIARGTNLGGIETTAATVEPTTGDDAEVLPTPSYSDSTDVLTAATVFTIAWLRRDLTPVAWHRGIAELCTKNLATSLLGVDPESVPASRSDGAARVVLRAGGFAQVVVDVDTGTVLLNLIDDGDRWLVDGVDWERA